MKTPRGECSNCANCPEHGHYEDALAEVIEELKDDKKILRDGFIALNPTLAIALIDDNKDIRDEAILRLKESE